MMRYKFTIGLAAAAFAMSLAPARAQDRSRPADAPTTGSAVPRDSGSSSGSSSSSSGGSSATSSSGSSSSSGGGSAWMGGGGYEAPRRAPVNPEGASYGDQRRGGGGTTTGRAVPRDRGDGGGNSGSGTATTRSNDGGDRQPAQGRSRAVPTYSRPRDGRNVLGTAVERPDGYYRDGRPYSYSTFIYDPYYSYYYDPYYRSRYYWSPWGYGFGFGYMAYDPFLFGSYGYPDYYGGYYDPYYGGGGGGYSSGAAAAFRGVGSLRLKVKPPNAQVFVDGYFVGTVDSFDGVFQRLNVEAGSHRIELKADGYAPTEFDVMVVPGETITYKGDMIRK